MVAELFPLEATVSYWYTIVPLGYRMACME